MRYIVNSSNYVLAVSFGSTIHYSDCDCTEYTGTVPSGWDSLEEWYEDEGDKLWRWKIVSGNLTMDSWATAPEEGKWGTAELQDKTLSGLFLTKTVVQADDGYDGLGTVTIEAQTLQNKSVAGPFLSQTTVQADSSYDALGSVVIAAQPYWYMVSSSNVTIFNSTTMYVPLPVADTMPSEILIMFCTSPLALSENQVSMVYIDLENTATMFGVSGGTGIFYHSTETSFWDVSLYSSTLLKIACAGSQTFYNTNASTNPMYRVYLMY